MKSIHSFAALAALVVAGPVVAQQPAKPGPEHDALKKLEGTWNLVMKADGKEHKGTTTYKMELGGMWLVGAMECDLGGEKFTGKSLDSYDAGKKKYVSVWADSMSASPMIFEGNYDADKKALTMTCDSVGPDGKPAKWKSVMTHPDADTINFAMYVGEGKEPMFTIVYKRKK